MLGVAGNKGGEVDVTSHGLNAFVEGFEQSVGGLNSGVKEADEEGIGDKSNSDQEDENVYLINVMYFLDGDGDEELQETRQNLKEVGGKPMEMLRKQ
ncbi:hypothetical protein J1N35_010666 [Gossypium stocksii]|uniref:Uncharacterized protein n=1 Tax=Gossypium stocksii TaxID=47602 RepID=A0A9D3W255_9ROSI|nr:hypothetical protein J1N35_010666 [Gossypium stocksii]